jgi:hypothetical protein
VSVTVCITTATLGYPQGAGHLWVYLNWALSLRALGCRVIWLEDLGEPSAEVEHHIDTLADRLDRWGLAGALALTGLGRYDLDAVLTAELLGLEDAASESDLLLDFMYETPAEVLSRFPRSALVDLDPGLLQLWMSRRDLNVSDHDGWFTIGETVGSRGAPFPDCGVHWEYTPPPVFLPAWPPVEASSDAAYTTVTNWWGDEWLELDGQPVSNHKRTSFLAYAELPRRCAPPVELALTPDDLTAETDQRLLEDNGWSVRDAWKSCATPESYRRYIASSRAEFSCAKPSCRLLRTAWISDRTICYLASGKPAVVEHTGASRFLPDAEGLFRFSTLDGAAAAIAAVESDYDRHAQSARKLAEEHFDGKRVVSSVLERALR